MQARLRVFVVGALVLGCSLLAAPSAADAQNKQIESSFQGALGLGLVGAELGAVIPAIAGVDPAWAYVVFPAIGAAGGAVAGYFALDQPNHVELSIGALTLGMALIIPALVVTLSATAYDAGDVDSGRPQPARAGTATAGAWARARVPAHQPSAARRRAGSGVLRVEEDGSLALAAPGVALVPGLRPSGEWRIAGMSVSLMSGQF